MSTATPFALVLPSRPVYAAPTAVSPSQYAFSIPSSPSFTHVVIFLTPGITLPPDTLAGVYIQFPSATPTFKFLGAIGNEKQSAIFRVRDGQSNGRSGDEDEMADIDSASPNPEYATTGNITIGVSVEPMASIQAQVAALQTLGLSNPQESSALVLGKRKEAAPVTTKLLAQRIIRNAFNFLASFAGNTGPGGEEVVPLKSFQAWWEKFERKVNADPTFLERQDDS